MSLITTVGMIVVLSYVVKSILDFYGFGMKDYGPYLVFYAFLVLMLLVSRKN